MSGGKFYFPKIYLHTQKTLWLCRSKSEIGATAEIWTRNQRLKRPLLYRWATIALKRTTRLWTVCNQSQEKLGSRWWIWTTDLHVMSVTRLTASPTCWAWFWTSLDESQEKRWSLHSDLNWTLGFTKPLHRRLCFGGINNLTKLLNYIYMRFTITY